MEAAAPLAPTTPLWLGEEAGWRPVPLWQRSQLQPQQRLDGPALVVDATTTTVLEPGWQALVLADGALLLERDGTAIGQAVEHVEQGPDPTLLELYNHRFAAIAEQMGGRLQQSARSVNIRERLDFSCALFDAAGQLVANAPHIPVHLGSMGDSVVSLLAAIARGERPPLASGDVVLSNNPYNGGTHLPDITAITPVFVPGLGDSQAGTPLFFVACRLGDFHIAGNHRSRWIGMQQGAGRHNQLDWLEATGIEGDLFAHQAAKHVEHHSLSYG